MILTVDSPGGTERERERERKREAEKQRKRESDFKLSSKKLERQALPEHADLREEPCDPGLFSGHRRGSRRGGMEPESRGVEDGCCRGHQRTAPGGQLGNIVAGLEAWGMSVRRLHL